LNETAPATPYQSTIEAGDRPEEQTMARRRYQKGQLFLRGKNRVWVGRWREDVIDSTGRKRVFRSEVLGDQKQFPTQRLARRELDKRLAKVNSIDYRPKQAITFTEFAEEWERTVLPTAYKPSFRVTAKSVVRTHLVPYFGHYQLWAIRPGDVQRFITGLKGKLQPTTIRTTYNILRCVWKVARGWKYVDHSPFEEVHPPQKNRTKRQPFTKEEVGKIISATASEQRKLMYWLVVETGLRIGELAALKVEDIDFDRRLLVVDENYCRAEFGTPKSESGFRTVDVSTPLLRCLRQLEGKKGLIFHTKKEKPICYEAEILALHKLLDRLGIARRGFHGFRYTNATASVSEGAPVKTLQARMGHADSKMTLDFYARSVDADGRALAEKLGVLFAPEVAPNLHSTSA
jgi:integrase